jgi:hypothetical protein
MGLSAFELLMWGFYWRWRLGGQFGAALGCIIVALRFYPAAGIYYLHDYQ